MCVIRPGSPRKLPPYSPRYSGGILIALFDFSDCSHWRNEDEVPIPELSARSVHD
jgi:hypothetical protein